MAKLNQLSHQENISGRRNVSERVHQAKYSFTCVGENIASGRMSIEQLMQGWMNSKNHRHNILNKVYRDIGTAVACADNGTYYWCVVFGRRMVK